MNLSRSLLPLAETLSQARAHRFLQRVQTIPDEPSERALNLKPREKSYSRSASALLKSDRYSYLI